MKTSCALVTGSLLFGLLTAGAADGKLNEKGQEVFATPDEAVSALRTAAEGQEKGGLEKVLGAEVRDVMTGDATLDADHAKKFAALMAEGCNQVSEGPDRITLEIGTNSWPFPIPLVRNNGQWYYDTAEGKEEIITRHIGKDELHAIGVCREYISAQRQFAGLNFNHYAEKFKSDAGKKNGLYWPSKEGESVSPFGPIVAEAYEEGYGKGKATSLHPFHGYYFRILTRQGAAAPGGRKDYIAEGQLTGGFALVAYPENWDQSGIMAFMVNQDGTVYQRNLGPKTSRLAGQIKEYNPDSQWSLVQDEGIMDAAMEK